MMVINMTNVVVLIGVIQKAYYDKQKDSYFVDLKLEKQLKMKLEQLNLKRTRLNYGKVAIMIFLLFPLLNRILF